MKLYCNISWQYKVKIIHTAFDLVIILLYPSYKNKSTLTMYTHIHQKNQMDYSSKTTNLRKSAGVNLFDLCLGKASQT